ncbi:MAG: carboxypeptidase T [Flavobacteriales bacterium]|jgi:carboxypeptidase T
MKKILLFLAIIAVGIANAQTFQDKYQRAQINYSEASDLTRLAELGIPVEHGVHKKGFFMISDFSVTEIALARQAGYSVDILIEDSKEHFLQQNRNPQPLQRNLACDGPGSAVYQTPENFELGSMGGYLTYQELLDELTAMKAAYPNLITDQANISNFMTEGTPDNTTTPSIGNNPIKWVKISDNPGNSEAEPQILYTAIHHAREPAGLSQLVFYMWYLLENYDTDPEVKSIVDNTELYFVPVINPDGYLYNQKTDPNGGGFWRKNRKNSYGTDLNRNYDYYINGDPNNGIWGGDGSSGNTGSEIYRGTAPFSEVENQAIKWFVENHDFVMAFNNHTSGDLLLYPFGYAENQPTPENALFEGISKELVSKNGFSNILSSELYAASGTSDDFMYGTVGTHNKVYAMTPEIGPSFWPPSNQIESICKSMMYLNLTSAKMVNNYASLTDTAPQYVGDQGTITTTFDVRRLGLSGNGDFTVSLNPISSNIGAAGAPISFTGLDVLDIELGSIQYTLNGGVSAGDDIMFELIINNGSFDTKIQVNKKFGTLSSIFADPGDSTTDNYNNDGWGTTTQTFVSPSSSITDSPNGNYQNGANETITLQNEIDLTNAIGANVTFYAKWEIENNFDYVQFQISTNGGSSWIPQCGNFTNEGSTNNSQPTGEPLFDGNQNDWVLEEINLNDYLGESILARFQLRSDNGLRQDGFFFDDLTFNVLDEGSLGVNVILENQFSLYPNPVETVLNITTALPNYSIDIFNIQGQLVHSIDKNTGSQSFDFSSYANGLYIFKITSDVISQTYKVLKE